MSKRIILYALLLSLPSIAIAQSAIADARPTTLEVNKTASNYTLSSNEIFLDDSIIVSANPSATVSYISSKILPNSIELYNTGGKFIRKYSSNKYVNFETLKQGVFILKLHYNDFTAVKKVIKK